MAEYISREAANKAIELLRQELEIDDADAAYNDALIDCRYYIAHIPAADVVEVRHGRWIEQSPDFDLCGVAYYKCSECGKEQQMQTHYCQFCGAKMDKEGNDNGKV